MQPPQVTGRNHEAQKNSTKVTWLESGRASIQTWILCFQTGPLHLPGLCLTGISVFSCVWPECAEGPRTGGEAAKTQSPEERRQQSLKGVQLSHRPMVDARQGGQRVGQL